jgi:oxygen-independent coproporphyrinogen-3 oxidase
VQPLENVETVVAEARRIGYTSINFDLVYGLPCQTQNSISQTVQEVIRLTPDRIAFYSYAHVPWLKPAQRKFSEQDLPGDAKKRELYETGLALLKEAGYEDIGMDHFALPNDALYLAQCAGSLHRNFMGYTTQYTELMIGLGASSISDSWTGFAQNIKAVELYEESVAAGKFPIAKGHLLTEEDRLVRQLILDLMCRYKINWSETLEKMPGFKDCLERCRDLQEDGLLNLYPHGMEVTETGKAFLRNVCLCFDLRYWRKVPEKQAFSSVA